MLVAHQLQHPLLSCSEEVIINYLKRQLSSLEAAALTQQPLTPENQPPSSLPHKQAGSRFVLLLWIAYI